MRETTAPPTLPAAIPEPGATPLWRGRALLGPPDPDHRPMRPAIRALLWAVAISVAGLVVAAWTARYIGYTRNLPPGPDMAWYTWRAQVLMTLPPSAMIAADGPLQVFGGGYRVTTPLLSALVQQVSGVDRFTASVHLTATRQAIVVLAIAAVAYRYWASTFLFSVTALFAGGFLFLRPFIGYTDNLMAFLFAAGALWFLKTAATEWPARIGLFSFVALMFFTHPPTASIFTAAVLGGFGLRVVLTRSLREPLRAEVWTLGAALGGALAAYLAWRLGMWGVPRAFSDAMHLPPYRAEVFIDVAYDVIRQMEPLRLVPLMLVGALVVLLARPAFAERPLSRALLVWTLPPLGMLAYLVGVAVPFKRFLTASFTPMLLAGVALWAVCVPLVRMARRGGVRLLGPVAAAALMALVLVPTWVHAMGRYEQQSPWLRPSVRVALAGVRGYLEEADVRRPVVFVVSADPSFSRNRIFGRIWRGTWSQVRAGIPGEHVPDTYLFLGAMEDFVAGRPTTTGNATLDDISRTTLEHMQQELRGRRPLVFGVTRLNDQLGNEEYLTLERATPVYRLLWVLRGPGFAEPEPEALLAGRRAAAAVRRSISEPEPPLARKRYLAVVGFGLGLVFVGPGLLAARWFRLRGLPALLGMVAPLSIAMNLVVAIIALAVLRIPLSPAVAWGSVLAANALGLVLLVVSLVARPPRWRRPEASP